MKRLFRDLLVGATWGLILMCALLVVDRYIRDDAARSIGIHRKLDAIDRKIDDLGRRTVVVTEWPDDATIPAQNLPTTPREK